MLFEPLDPRRLFALLAGSVFTDADSSTTFDTTEKGLAGLTVFVDANANGRLDKGESSAVTDRGGNYQFKGLAAGTYSLGVVAPAGTGQTTPGQLGSTAGGFDITLTGLADLQAPVRRAFQAAAAKWESVITGDLPDSGTIDDLRIDIGVDRIDGPGGTLAQSGPERTRTSGLPLTGSMEFDRSDVADLLADGTLVYTITHEMAHVLGFGTVWGDKNLISGEGTRSSRFTGRQAVAEYKDLFDLRSASSVPLETGGGDGTADSHWPERTFNNELMTGYAEGEGIIQPLSRITAATFADLGYSVDLAAADTWNPATQAAVLTTPLSLGVRSFERRVTLGRDTDVTTLNFGYRANTAPTIGGFTAASGILGQSTTLTARNVTDAEDDAIVGVSFYGESNGVAGLQAGRGGDAYLGAASTASGSAWTITAATTALAAGQQTYYALAQDDLGSVSRRGTTGTLTAPLPPVRPNPVAVTRVSATEALIQWKDRSDNEIGFRVELLDEAGTVVRTANVAGGTTQRSFAGLTHLAIYTARVRSYGYGGASAYTRTDRFRV